MPSIIVRAEAGVDREGSTLLQETVRPADLESEHFSAQLIQRVAWAVVDAHEVEALSKAQPGGSPDLHPRAPGG